MLGTAKLMAFAATTDAARAQAFYETTLGLRLVAEEPYALVFDANGTMLRVQKVREHTPPPFTALGWEVADIRATIQALVERGVSFERYDFVPQDALGVWDAGGALVAWFKDPDGNLLSLTQFSA